MCSLILPGWPESMPSSGTSKDRDNYEFKKNIQKQPWSYIIRAKSWAYLILLIIK